MIWKKASTKNGRGPLWLALMTEKERELVIGGIRIYKAILEHVFKSCDGEDEPGKPIMAGGDNIDTILESLR